MVKNSHAHTSFEIKSSDISVLSINLKTENINIFLSEFNDNFGPNSEEKDFFNNDNVIIDLTNFTDSIDESIINNIKEVIKKCKLNPIAIRSNNNEVILLAKKLGLDEASPDIYKNRKEIIEEKPPQLVQGVVQEVVREVVAQTMVIDKPLRSGQKVYARGCDLVVLAMVNQGAEVISDGNIHVYAPLRGKAMAGARGNTEARIFTMCLEAELISVAGVYRTSENPLPDDVKSKPAQIRLSNDGQEKMIIESLKL